MSKSSDFLKEPENVSEEGTSRNGEEMGRRFLFAFAAGFIRVPFQSMAYDDARIE